MLARTTTIAAMAWCAAVAPAQAEEQSTSDGGVRATVSWQYSPADGYTDLWLTVTRDGELAYDRAVAVRGCLEPGCMPLGAGRDRRSVRVRDLDADGEPEVVLDLFLGGAHCCVVSELLHWDGSRYRAMRADWGDSGYRLADVGADDRPELVTGDQRFAYAFASFADSRFPVRVLVLRDGRLHEVTHAYPQLVRADARRHMREYRRDRGGRWSAGELAAWAADQYLLGRRAAADRFLRAELRAGRLEALSGYRSGERFVEQLQRRLRAWGY